MKVSVAEADLERFLEETRAWCDRALRALLADQEREAERRGEPLPGRLGEAMAYALLGGGKRLRPVLVRLVCEALGGDARAAEAPALAIELVHTYSLVHDDLPAMDDDDLRRGRATCHVVYGEALGILVGDALQTLAFEVLARRGQPAAELVVSLARASGAAGMVGGQVLDLFADQRPEGPEGVRAVHRLKTAALFGAAAEMGALAAGAAPGAVAAARDYGRALGLAFQAVDDVLDVTGDAATLGKTPGKDAALERHTLVDALGLDGARAEAAARAEEARAAGRLAGFAPDGPAFLLLERLLARRT